MEFVGKVGMAFWGYLCVSRGCKSAKEVRASPHLGGLGVLGVEISTVDKQVRNNL